MLPAVVPITVVGTLVGLVVVAAAAVFWARRRRQELMILAAHGVGALALGVKGVVEALPALLLGTGAGWVSAWSLVRRIGPSPVLSAEAAPLAAAGSAAAVAVAAVLTGVIASSAARRLTDQARGRRHGLLTAVPWELAMLAAAAPVWFWLGGQRVVSDIPGGIGSVAHVPGRLLIVPILVVAGGTILAARLGAWYLRSAARRRTPRSAAALLSWRRLTRHALIAAVLAAATSMPVALALYGATVTRSIQTTIDNEARLQIGTDVILTLRERAPVPASLSARATEVLRLDGAVIGGVQTDLLGVDPDSFERAAFWDERLTGASMHDLLAPLRDADAVRSRIVVASYPAPAGQQPQSWIGDPPQTVQVQQVSVLPGQRGGYPAALVPKDSLGIHTKFAVPQLWLRGDPAQIRKAVEAANLPVARILTISDLFVNSVSEPLTYTFAYLTALSLLTGVVTVVGLLVYLESQAPAHRRSFVLLRRMGLSRASHRRAVLGELAPPLLAGLIGGVALATGLTTVLGRDFEMNPTIPPDTAIDPPYLALVLTAVAVAAVAIGAALYNQYRIGRANAAEVLRDTA
jgi:putative ABC transport system permease protein